MKNTYQIINIIGSIQGLFIFFLLIIRKENKLANKILALLIFIITIHLATTFFHTNNDAINDFIAIGRSDMFIFFYGPLIAFYTLFLTGFKEKLKLKYFFHLIPAIILLFVLLISYLYGDFTNLQIWDENNPYSLKLWYIIHSTAIIHMFCYLIYGYSIAYKYKKQLTSYFSQKGKIYLLWLQILLLSMIIMCILAVIQFFIHSFHDPEGILQWIISISIVLLVFTLGYFTNKQPDILEDLKEMNLILTDNEKKKDSNNEYQFQRTVKIEGKKIKYERNRLDEKEEI